MSTPAPRPADAPAPAPAPAPVPPRVRSEQLLRGGAELLIEHHGSVYRLKQTSLGKLILTK